MNSGAPPGKSARIWRAIALATLAGWAIYNFSPAFRNHFGSVKPPARRVAPSGDVTARTLDGGEWSLAGNRGKVVLVNFWATWCRPCRIETPALVELHNRYASRGFLVAGIAMDDDPRKTVPEFVREHSISYPVLVPAGPSAFADSVEALPTSILIDRSGRVARVYEGMVSERGLRGDIETLLGETE